MNDDQCLTQIDAALMALWVQLIKDVAEINRLTRRKTMHLKDLPAGQIMVDAMQTGVCVDLAYRDSKGVITAKTAEVHAVGVSPKGLPCARVWQMGGESAWGEKEGWKMLTLSGVEHIRPVLGARSQAPRPGYSPGDKGMGTIFAEISNAPVPEKAPA